MANANITLPYGVTKQIQLRGKNAANTDVRPLSAPITATSSNPTVSVSVNAADLNNIIVSAINNNATQNFTGTFTWTAKNELGNTISSTTFFTAVQPDPAVTIESTEIV